MDTTFHMIEPTTMPNHIEERNVLMEISIEKNADGVHPPPDESVSVEIISCGEAFEPYQSQFARELSDEFRLFEKQRKRARDLRNWKWDEVIDLDPDVDGDLLDTADSASTLTRRVKSPLGRRSYSGFDAPCSGCVR